MWHLSKSLGRLNFHGLIHWLLYHIVFLWAFYSSWRNYSPVQFILCFYILPRPHNPTTIFLSPYMDSEQRVTCMPYCTSHQTSWPQIWLCRMTWIFCYIFWRWKCLLILDKKDTIKLKKIFHPSPLFWTNEFIGIFYRNTGHSHTALEKLLCVYQVYAYIF